MTEPRISLGRSTAKRTIDLWQLGSFYGEPALHGYVDGRYMIALFRWWAQDRFGVSWGHAPFVEETLIVGRRL